MLRRPRKAKNKKSFLDLGIVSEKGVPEMNELRVITLGTEDPKVFDTYWRTGLVQKGRVRTTVFVTDDCAKVAAELSALQYLLESKNACGHDKTGSGLRLFISQDEIMALLNQTSHMHYLSEYAAFLKTRFYGAEVAVSTADISWADEMCDRQVDDISVYSPSVTRIEVAGIGPVELTAHAVFRYVQRFGRPAGKAWRDLVKLAKEAVPITVQRKEIHNIKHRNRGIYCQAKQVVLVITPPDHPGQLPRLVTVTQKI